MGFSKFSLLKACLLQFKCVLERINASVVLCLFNINFEDALLRFEFSQLRFKGQQGLLLLVYLAQQAWVDCDRFVQV